MMRRTVLLLATTALTLIVAGGIALAATAIDCAVVGNPCDGTPDDDVITGTVGAETINGKGGADQISALDAIDTLNGEDGDDTIHGELGDDVLNGGDGTDQLFGDNGRDRLNGGAGNDTLAGGPETADASNYCSDSYSYYCSDSYSFTPNWGNDIIIEGLGRGSIVPTSATAAAMPNLKVNLVSDPDRPEVSDGNGNTMNWENNDVYNAVTGAGDDEISQRPQIANGMNGGAGNDTYTGYDPGVRNGGDSINDPSGTADVLDLSKMNLGDVGFRGWGTSTNMGLSIYLTPRISVCDYSDNCNYTYISGYFDNTSTDACANGPGPGLIENIKFAGDKSVDFQQVRSLLGCPPPDTTAPDTSITSGPNGPTNNTAPTFTFTGSDNRTTTANLKYQYQLDSGGWSTASTSTTASLTGLSEGSHTFYVKAKDEAGNEDQSPAQRSFTVDTTAPKVNSVSPTDPTIAARSTDVEANFSEKVVSSSINTSTFKLYSCTSTTSTNCTNQVTKAPVSLSTDGLKATLNPSTSLGSRTRYKAVLTTGVTDVAGNALNQQTVWYFTTGRT